MTCKQTKTHQTGFIALTKSSIFRLKPKRNSFYIKLPVFTKNFRWLVNGGAWGWAVCFLSGILEHYDYCLCFCFFLPPPQGPPKGPSLPPHRRSHSDQNGCIELCRMSIYERWTKQPDQKGIRSIPSAGNQCRLRQDRLAQ